MQPISSILPSLLRSVSEDSDTALVFLQELWPQIVGKRFGRYTRPLSFAKKELTLAVADEAWLKEGRQLAHTIREAINRYWGVSLVEKLRFELHQDISDQF